MLVGFHGLSLCGYCFSMTFLLSFYCLKRIVHSLLPLPWITDKSARGLPTLLTLPLNQPSRDTRCFLEQSSCQFCVGVYHLNLFIMTLETR